jgi:hypothetical protein
VQKGTTRTHSYGDVTETVTHAAQEHSLSATPRWLAIGLAIGGATAAVGLWLVLIARGHPPFAPLPAGTLGGGLVMAALFGLTAYLGMSGYTEQAAAINAGIATGLPYVQKPFTAAEFAQQVRNALDR